MSFSINPSFSFSLNRILVGSVKFGKYDGIHVCLTAVTSTDKVILHNPYKKLSESNNRLSWAEASSDIAVLNFNQEIRAIETGFLSSDPKDILVIGSPTQLLAYHVDNNRDLFYKEILEGIFIILIGKCCSFENPLVIVGGNQYIRGYDIEGNEKLWIVTSGKVNSLALVDFNNDGKNEIVCGCDNGTIKIYQNDSLLSEFFENSSVIQVSRIDVSSLLAYSLNDGKVGVYNEGIRLWRIKSKSKGLSMACFDLLGTGSLQLIIGWESGKVDIRDIATGESLFKLSLNQMVISVMQADYRGRGVNDLVICTRNGDVKGTTKVFMRSPRTVFEMEEFRRNRLNQLIVIIQTKFRSYIQRKRYLQLRDSQIIISRAWRSWRDARFGLITEGRRHIWQITAVAKEKQRVLRCRKASKWAVDVIQNHYIRKKKYQFLVTLMKRLPPGSLSPISNEWVAVPTYLTETSCLLRSIFHKWRCHKYRRLYDQVSRNRMREKLTASILFKNRKTSYPLSVPHPFLGDYVRLRQNIQWKKLCMSLNDQYIVFADVVKKITRSTGKVSPILMALSTNAMLLLDQKTLQIKYRIPATEIYRLSLSPYHDNIAVFHLRDSEMGRKKGDFVFQTAHVIEVITKLFLVIQNATGRQPEICIDSEFDVMFSNQAVTLSFKLSAGLNDAHAALLSPQVKITRKSDRMEIII